MQECGWRFRDGGQWWRWAVHVYNVFVVFARATRERSIRHNELNILMLIGRKI